jgi:hypothetical protein
MVTYLQAISLCAAVSLISCGDARSDPVTWHLDNLDAIAGQPVTVAGNPRVIDTPDGKAIEFDGIDDGIFLDVHPLAGMSAFTVEVIFKPYADGAAEQRFFHMQENASDSRVMFETRLFGNQRWFLDTFIKSGDQSITLYAEDDQHALGPWYHAAIVVDENSFSHYVNGHLELNEAIDFETQGPGKASLGVRLNTVHWFKGAIRTVRFTARGLTPGDFLTVAD